MYGDKTVDVYERLSERLGREETRLLLDYLEERETEMKSFLVTREHFDLTMKEFDFKMGKFDVKISELKAEMIKWMFLFWLGQAATIFALIKIFMK